jgi:outer membrane protein
MRSILTAGAVALCLGLPQAVSAQAAAPQKFAYVNSQAILAAAPGAAEAQAQFQKDVEGLRSQVAALGDSLNQMQQAFQREEPGLSPQAKESRLASIREKTQEYEQRVAALNQQAEQRQVELMQPIMDRVRAALDELREEMGYAFIFDIANGGMIVAADKNLDVTDKVIARVRAKGATATTPAAGPASRASGVTTRQRP